MNQQGTDENDNTSNNDKELQPTTKDIREYQDNIAKYEQDCAKYIAKIEAMERVIEEHTDDLFRPQDVLALAREVASDCEPHTEEDHIGRDYAVCHYCDGNERLYNSGNKAWRAAKKRFEHEPNCAWLIAKDMLTGY